MQRCDPRGKGVEQLLFTKKNDLLVNVKSPARLNRQVAQQIIAEHQIELAILAESQIAMYQLKSLVKLSDSVATELFLQLGDSRFALFDPVLVSIERARRVPQLFGQLLDGLGAFSPTGRSQIELLGCPMSEAREPLLHRRLPVGDLPEPLRCKERLVRCMGGGKLVGQLLRLFVPEVLGAKQSKVFEGHRRQQARQHQLRAELVKHSLASTFPQLPPLGRVQRLQVSLPLYRDPLPQFRNDLVVERFVVICRQRPHLGLRVGNSRADTLPVEH